MLPPRTKTAQRRSLSLMVRRVLDCWGQGALGAWGGLPILNSGSLLAAGHAARLYAHAWITSVRVRFVCACLCVRLMRLCAADESACPDG